MEKQHPYADLLHLPHHVSDKHPQMSLQDRAAQFSPFAALTGYDASIKETARQTDTKIELGEDEITNINQALNTIQQAFPNVLEVEITYFQPDIYKDGGSYQSIIGYIKKIDTYQRMLILQDGPMIEIDEIIAIQIL